MLRGDAQRVGRAEGWRGAGCRGAFSPEDAPCTRIVRFIPKTALPAGGRKTRTEAVAVSVCTGDGSLFKHANAFSIYACLPLLIKHNEMISWGLLYGSKGKEENGSSECLCCSQEAPRRCCFIQIIIWEKASKCWLQNCFTFPPSPLKSAPSD